MLCLSSASTSADPADFVALCRWTSQGSVQRRWEACCNHGRAICPIGPRCRTLWNFVHSIHLRPLETESTQTVSSPHHTISRRICLMLACVNKLPSVFILFSIQLNPISITPLERAQCKQETFHSSTYFWLLDQACASVSSTCCPALLTRSKTHPIPYRAIARVPAILGRFFRKPRSLVSNCCIWSDYVFHMRHSLADCFRHVTRTNCSIQSQRMSFSHVPSISVSLRFQQIRSIFFRKEKIPRISSVFLIGIYSHFILPHLASCHHPTKEPNIFATPCHQSFFQRLTPCFLPANHYLALLISVVPRTYPDHLP